MFRNMVTSLFKNDRIKTTDTKAKELRRWADRIITLAKRGDLHARRQALAIIREKDVVHKLFEEAGQRFGGSAGGYTRVVKIGNRPGDAAPVSLVELVSSGQSTPKAKKSQKKAKQTVIPAPKADPKKASDADAASDKDTVEKAEASSAQEAKPEAAASAAETDAPVEAPSDASPEQDQQADTEKKSDDA